MFRDAQPETREWNGNTSFINVPLRNERRQAVGVLSFQHRRVQPDSPLLNEDQRQRLGRLVSALQVVYWRMEQRFYGEAGDDADDGSSELMDLLTAEALATVRSRLATAFKEDGVSSLACWPLEQPY